MKRNTFGYSIRARTLPVFAASLFFTSEMSKAESLSLLREIKGVRNAYSYDAKENSLSYLEKLKTPGGASSSDTDCSLKLKKTFLATDQTTILFDREKLPIAGFIGCTTTNEIVADGGKTMLLGETVINIGERDSWVSFAKINTNGRDGDDTRIETVKTFTSEKALSFRFQLLDDGEVKVIGLDNLGPLTPDGQRQVVSGRYLESRDNSKVYLQSNSGETLAVLQRPSAYQRRRIVPVDNKRILLLEDKQVGYYSIANDRFSKIFELTTPSDIDSDRYFQAAAFSPEQRYLATLEYGNGSSKVAIYDTANGALLHSVDVSDASFKPLWVFESAKIEFISKNRFLVNLKDSLRTYSID